jgi:hypothetical protein
MANADANFNIPVFDGCTDVREFIRKLKILAAIQEWADDKQLLNIQ